MIPSGTSNKPVAEPIKLEESPTLFDFNLFPAGESTTQPVVKPATASRLVVRGRQITRNRASYSCHTCRRRKVKCDKVHPICGNCAKNAAQCLYDATAQRDIAARKGRPNSAHGAKRRRQMPKLLSSNADESPLLLCDGKNQSGRGSNAIEARLDKLTSMIERLSRTNEPLDVLEKDFLVQNPSVALLQKDFRENSLRTSESSTSPARSPRLTAESSGDEFPIPAGGATDPVDPVGTLNLGHLSLEDGGRSRYVGTTYWAYISHEINELNQLLRDQNRLHKSPSEESSNDEIKDCSVSPTESRRWKSSPGQSDGRLDGGSVLRRESFQESVLALPEESPVAYQRLVEPSMLDNIPTKRQSHILYKGFMSGVHAISPVLHPPTILKLYNAFWEWYDSSSYSGEPCPDPSFIPLLYAIWYGGSVTVSIRLIEAEFNVSSRTALSKTYHEEVNRWLNKISFPRSPSLQGLAAYLLVQTILSKEEEPLASSLFISLAMRVAQTMGLHRDPAQFGIKRCEAEYRRRLWWHIVHMDGVVAMSSGLPPLVSDENYWDVRETSEVKDTLLGLPEAEEYERIIFAGLRSPDDPDDPNLCNGPSMVNVYYLSAKGKYIMARAVRRILKIQLGTRPITRRDMEELRSILLDLQIKLNNIVNRIPPGSSHDASSGSSCRSPSVSSQSRTETRSIEGRLPGEGPFSCPEQYHSPVLVAFHKWAKILMSLFVDKAFCVAYQPFLKNAKSRIWPAARQSALRHCHGFMEKFVQLATDPDFQPFQWSWPGNHQPMHATMIMLIDLYERPSSPEASKSRAFIDRIFSLTGPDGGVVGGEDGISLQRPLKDGGREAWNMIRRLRQKAWQKAGLDPQQLWTEQAQIQAGIVSSEQPHSLGSTQTPSRASDDEGNSSIGTAKKSSLSYMAHQRHDPSPQADSQAHGQTAQSYRGSSHIPESPEIVPSKLLRPTLPEYTPVPPPAGLKPIHATSAPSSSQSMSRLNATRNSLPQSVASPGLRLPDVPGASGDLAGDVDVSTPPSLVDPNFSFDWDQWDAVFGQHLPVADELMELDPVAGFELSDFGGSASRSGSG